jgi:hypothetical protein
MNGLAMLQAWGFGKEVAEIDRNGDLVAGNYRPMRATYLKIARLGFVLKPAISSR